MDILAKLFGSSLLVRTMRFFLFHPDISYDVKLLKEKANTSSPELRRCLQILLSARFIKRRGNKWVFNSTFPYREQLSELLIGNLLLTIDIVQVLQKAGKLKFVAATGVFTHDRESRTDLLIVGDKVNQKILGKAITHLESELGTEIKYALFMTSEFQYRLSVNDKLIRDILDYPHEVLLDKLTTIRT